ncbi:hypothetical protein GQ43DRAFT_474704 [Delitschia confertaspora ATCC 74209]|uniref:Uncharacterized protein n=1 Tax=Delitschia confertaspora ATCC 74209 TaxID=1513339 RepID=A0A9P4JKA2_9PLEO|nr:hypothetical protein GQ43DRAFT_474704 [Delitschia confertaspora ATCC 74209]
MGHFILKHRGVMVRRNWYSSQPASGAQPSMHREFYKSFGYPVLKVFMGAVFTYQLLYWTWMKLESLEAKKDKNDEIASLEQQLRDLKIRKGEPNKD